jgi:hypothetical protein
VKVVMDWWSVDEEDGDFEAIKKGFLYSLGGALVCEVLLQEFGGM